MCGIAGIYQFSSSPEEARNVADAMAQAMAYRGPDAHQLLTLDQTVFAHRRLAILDLDAVANQPFCAADRSCMIVFNGEIYNFQAIRTRLQQAGSFFRTHGDTEVILELYRHGGVEALAELDGMFALAIYDTRSRELFLMRDRFGKKPLYYFQTESGVVFASELGALKRHHAFPRTLRTEAIADFLAYEYVPGQETVYAGVYQLPPATWLRFTPEGPDAMHRYWHLQYASKSVLSYPDAVDAMREKLNLAVRKRLIADVPCGIFLSGGIDSGIIAYLASQYAAAPLNAFTIGFAEERFDERNLATCSAKWVQTHSQHGLLPQSLTVDCRNFELIPQLLEHVGEPFADFSMVPTWYLSRFAAQSVKLVLSGDGADELFGGYERYLAMKYCMKLDKLLPPVLRRTLGWMARLLPDGGKRSASGRIARLLRLVATEPGRRYFALMSQITAKQRKMLYGERLNHNVMPDSARFLKKIACECTANDPVEQCAETDVSSYMVQDILVKVDRMAMANSLEVRSPFLDKEVAELAASLPFSYHQDKNERKKLLKTSCQDALAPEVRNARKRGFALPIGEWINGDWKQQWDERLLEGVLLKDHWLNPVGVKVLLSEHRTGRHDHTELLSTLMMLELFLEKASE